MPSANASSTPIELSFRKPISQADRATLVRFADSARRRGYIVTEVETDKTVTAVARESRVPSAEMSGAASC